MSRRTTMATGIASKYNLDALSNTELRELLVQHGLPNLPVTNSTRSVLISRLRKKMSEKPGRQTTAGSASSYLARYSSAEEESDREQSSKAATASATPQHISRSPVLGSSTGGSMGPPASTQSSAKRKRASQGTSYSYFSGSGSSSASSSSLPTIKVPIQPRSSVYIPPPIVHGSDTEESDSGSTARDSRNPYLSYGRLSGLSFPKRYSPAPQDHNSPSVSVNSLSNSSRMNDSHSGGSSGGEDSPYVSDFTRRLLQFRQEPQDQRRNTTNNLPPPNPRYMYRVPNRHTQHSLVHQASLDDRRAGAATVSISKNPIAWLQDVLNRWDDHYGVRQNLVPFVLVGAVVLFVAFLVFMYLTISPDLVSTITLISVKYQGCLEEATADVHSGQFMVPGENCIFENDLEPALEFLKLITPELQSRVERHMCKDPGLPFMLSASDAVKMRVDQMPSHDEYDTQRQLRNMEYLVEMNPQWRISNLVQDGNRVTIAQLRNNFRGEQTNAFGILNPRLPLTCIFLRKLQTFFFVVGTLGVAAIVAYLVNAAYKWRQALKQEKQQKLNRLISQILQIVMDQATNYPGNADAAAVVVNHLRDKIIEPAQRTAAAEKLWKAAIAFLEQNESRVQFEVGTRNGEECRLVRWVDTIASPTKSPTSVSSPQLLPNGAQKTTTSPASNLYNSAQLSKVGKAMLTAKKWQSPAFDKSNKITSPPTPCLKIRQMFDKFEAANPNLRTIIADAILEKVGPTCKIYDILLEPQACCVYVRCATAKDAGMVHDEINGWWFDNRLVSIKFLRLERFMDRFPESANTRHLMRPSNPQKLSLTQCNQPFGGDHDDDEEEDDVEEEEDDLLEDDGYGLTDGVAVNGR